MTSRRKWALVPGFAALAVAVAVLSAYSGASSSQNFAPEQPIAFPHPVHVQTLGMNCLYCHYSANKSPDPGLPAVGTCLGCHNHPQGLSPKKDWKVGDVVGVLKIVRPLDREIESTRHGLRGAFVLMSTVAMTLVVASVVVTIIAQRRRKAPPV